MKRLHNYSQHFLRNPRFVGELIGHTSIKRSDVVLDIGAGSGVISSVLARRCKQVVAIEAEKKTASLLRKNMARYANVTVEEADFLTMDLPNTPYKVFANIPFYLSSSILRKLTTASIPPTTAYLVVQKQFADKLLPDHHGFSNQLGMALGARFSFRIRKRLRRTDFWPFPNVDTVLLEIRLRDQPLIPKETLQDYTSFVETNFTNQESFSKLPLAILAKDSSIKPSSLTLSDWVVLFQATR